MMHFKHIARIACLAVIWLVPTAAHAVLNTAFLFPGFSNRTPSQIVFFVAATMVQTATAVCTALFIVGALFFITAVDREERRTRGKDMMIGSLIGIAVIISAKAILNFTMHFIYCGYGIAGVWCT